MAGKTEELKIRLTPDQKALIRERSSGSSMSRWILSRLLYESAPERIEIPHYIRPHTECAELERFCFQLREMIPDDTSSGLFFISTQTRDRMLEILEQMETILGSMA